MSLIALLALVVTTCDDKEALEKAVAKVAAYESYAFKGETELQSQFGNLPGQVPSMDGKYQKDVGMHIKTERGEFFRKGDRVLVKQGQAEWTDVANVQAPTPPADAPPKKRGGRGGAGFAQMMMKNFKAPHDDVKDLAKNFKEVKKQEKTEKIGDVECTVYAGDLSDESMKSSPLGRMLGMFGDQRSTAFRHLGVLAGLVERLQRRPHLVARDSRRQSRVLAESSRAVRREREGRRSATR